MKARIVKDNVRIAAENGDIRQLEKGELVEGKLAERLVGSGAAKAIELPTKRAPKTKMEKGAPENK